MYASKSSYIIGFHGLDEDIGKQALNGEIELSHSRNAYDWLGNGVYFWENSCERARQYAIEDSKRKKSKIKKPFVIGAVLDLGNCLDLLDKKYLDYLLYAYKKMEEELIEQGKTLPENKKFGKKDFDFKNRELDCAVIRYAVALTEETNRFDSVRSVFWEGDDLYEHAGFKTHNHIQLSILNQNCIKGIFLPREKI